MSEPQVALRLGRWEHVLSRVTCDAVITDPPYSERTAKGQRGNRKSDGSRLGSSKQSGVTYGWLTEADVHALVRSWTPRTRRWFVMFGDHYTVRWALEALKSVGWYHFAPVPWVKPDAAPRIASDGPSPTAEFIAVARPRRMLSRAEKRFRRGHYEGPSRPGRIPGLIGAKPLWLLEQIIADYSEPGDVIADPFAGGGSALRAALKLGRSAIGSEVNAVTHARAMQLLAGSVLAKETT